MTKGTKQWQSYHNKKRKRSSDASKKDMIQAHLNNLKINFTQDQNIHNNSFTTRNKIHSPDLTNPQLLFELDGSIHGDMMMEESAQTQARNDDYNRAGLDYVIVNEQLANDFNLDLLDLSAYLIIHELNKIQSKMRVKQ